MAERARASRGRRDPRRAAGADRDHRARGRLVRDRRRQRPSSIRGCWTPCCGCRASSFVPPALAGAGVRQPAAADRPRPDHLAASGRGGDDPSAASRAGLARARGRHRLGLSDRDPGRARRRGRDHRGGRAARPRRARPGSTRWAIGTSCSRSATARAGCPARAPFEAILVTAAAPAVPRRLALAAEAGRAPGDPARSRPAQPGAGPGREGRAGRRRISGGCSRSPSCR